MNFDEPRIGQRSGLFVCYRRRALIPTAPRSILFLRFILITVIAYVSLLINSLRMLRRVSRRKGRLTRPKVLSVVRAVLRRANFYIPSVLTKKTSNSIYSLRRRRVISIEKEKEKEKKRNEKIAFNMARCNTLARGRVYTHRTNPRKLIYMKRM